MTPIDPQWARPALAGLALVLGLLACEAIVEALGRRRTQAAPGAAYLFALLATIASAAALATGLALGIWRAGDAGLSLPDWRAAAEWWPGYVAGMAVWVAALFGANLRTDRRTGPFGGVALAAHLVTDQVLLACLTAALVSALGLYWAAWAAVGLRLSLRWWGPVGLRLRPTGARAELLWRGALDITATVVVIMTGSVWLALATRCVVWLSSMLASALAQAHRGRAQRTGASIETPVDGPRRD